MNWFAEQRQAWIEESIAIFGFINRRHLIRKFGVSVPQAALDLQAFQKRRPGRIRYDAKTKRYVATGQIDARAPTP